jgi:WD40 repeat protein
MMLALSADGTTLYSGSWDRTIKQWNVQDDDPQLEPTRTLRDHNSCLSHLVLSADGHTLYSGSIWDPSIMQWDIQDDHPTLQPRRELENSGNTQALVLSTDGHTLYAAWDNHIVRYDWYDLASAPQCITTLNNATQGYLPKVLLQLVRDELCGT